MLLSALSQWNWCGLYINAMLRLTLSNDWTIQAVDAVLETSEGDMRKAITTLQSAARLKGREGVTKADIVEVAGVKSSVCLLWRFILMLNCQHTIACIHTTSLVNKKAQLLLTNPRDAKACQKLLQFDVLTTLSLTILAYLHAFSCRCVRNLRNPAKFTNNSNLWSSRSSKVIDLGANRKPICDLLLVINSNFNRICYRFRDIHG